MSFIDLINNSQENNEEIYVFNKTQTHDFFDTRVYGNDKLSFSDTFLLPSWFLKCDARKFVFINIDWGSTALPSFGSSQYVKNEYDQLVKDKINTHLLVLAYRNLAVNAEENNRFNEASAFRKMSFEAERLERRAQQKRWIGRFAGGDNVGISEDHPFEDAKDAWVKIARPLRIDLPHFLYRLSSGYGEHWLWALFILILIWLLPFLFYISPAAQFEKERPLPEIILLASQQKLKPEDVKPNLILGPSLEAPAFYSLNVMAFQKPEPKPANGSWLTRLVVILQTILGPVQATLLLLAIRRKFMR